MAALDADLALAGRKPIAAQDFQWHDAGRGATYLFGKDGYLAMDGSRGRIRCSRALVRPAAEYDWAIGLRLRVALGKPYRIALQNAQGGLAAGCLVDPGGCLCSVTNGSRLEPLRSLTFHYGKPFADSSLRPSHVVPSDEHYLRFRFSSNTVELLLDEQEPVVLDAFPIARAREVTRVALSADETGPGNLMLLREYVECVGDSVSFRERFPVFWEPVHPPPDGMPDDNVCQTLMRPVEDRWLETATAYGYVKARIPCLSSGAVEFEMKTTDATQESCLILEERQGIVKYGNSQLGLLRGRMVLCTEQGITAFDRPIDVAGNRVYHIRVAWDLESNVVRMWIDGQAMTRNSNDRFTFVNRPACGIDTLTLHPGDPTARPSLLQKEQGVVARSVEPLRTYWGAFRVYDLRGDEDPCAWPYWRQPV